MLICSGNAEDGFLMMSHSFDILFSVLVKQFKDSLHNMFFKTQWTGSVTPAAFQHLRSYCRVMILLSGIIATVDGSPGTGTEMELAKAPSVQPMVNNYFVLGGLPGGPVNIEYSSDLKRWRKEYHAISSDRNLIPVRGDFTGNRYWRVVPTDYTKPQGRILRVDKREYLGSDDDSEVPPPPGMEELTFGDVSAAFKACRHGDTVVIEEGEYSVDPVLMSSFLVPEAPLRLHHLKDVTVRGVGKVRITGFGPGTSLHIRGCENLTLENLSFIGDRPDVPENPVRLFATVLLSGYNNHLIFRGCRFEKFGNHAISQLHDPRASRNVLIENCHFEDGGDFNVPVLLLDGAAISGIGSDWHIHSNQLINCNRGIEIEGAFPGFPTQDVLIENNRIHGSNNIGIMIFSTMSPSDHYNRITIATNTITNTDSLFSHAIAFDGGKNIHVIENTVRGVGLGLWIPASSDVTQLHVIGNTITESASGMLIRSYPGMRTEYILSGNRIENNLDFGAILFGGTALIEKNIFRSNGQVYDNSGDLLIFRAPFTSTDITVYRNSFFEKSGLSEGSYHIVYEDRGGLIRVIDNQQLSAVSESAEMDILTASWSEFLDRRLEEENADDEEDPDSPDDGPLIVVP